ncbi:hypothetical protein BLNAU_965 [Blattamonas nauphoetae]|uniref:Uncharacterized protein n=1 Tax=Blattamonas nauphoetae TaxID=2049346 RepID=A0ABQ9YJF8_9EUKA|nr:hypothetical protein BLNAU_965 [Blattamonas nauphoetae]
MLLESVIRKAALPDDPHASECEYVFTVNWHACLDSNSHHLLRTFLTNLCTFTPASSIPMTFRLIPPSGLDDLKDTLHPSSANSHQTRPFLVPLSEPQQLDDGTVYLNALGNMIPLSTFTDFLVSRQITVSSQTVIMWYIECILGVEARFNLRLADSPLRPDDIFVDSLFRFLINPLPSLPASQKTEQSTYSLSTEIEHVSKYFVELITKLNEHYLILVPTINATDIFRSIEISAITSLVDTKLLDPTILKDSDFFRSIQSPNLNHLPSSHLPRTAQWISDILRKIKDWYRVNLKPGFDRDLLNDSLSEVLSDPLSEYRPLFDNPEGSYWNDFLGILRKKATGRHIEPNIMFLADDLYKPARDTIQAEAGAHLLHFGQKDQFGSDPTLSLSSDIQNSEASTILVQSDPHWGGDDIPNYAYKAGETLSQSTIKRSFVSKRTSSLRTPSPSPSPMAPSIPGGTLHERPISHISTPIVKISPVALDTSHHIPDIAPEDEKSRHSRQTEEERQIVDSLHLISSRTSGKHMFSSSLSLSQDFTIDISRLNDKEKFDHTLFDSIDDIEVDKRLQKCVAILQKTGRADHIDLTDSFIDSLCACLGGSDEQCCQRSLLLLTILFDNCLDDSLKKHVLENLKDAFVDPNNYQALFLIRVYGNAMRRTPENFSVWVVNWRDVSLFQTMDYNIRLAQMAFVRDAVVLFGNRCSLDIFDPKLIVGRLVKNYNPFSLTSDEITKYNHSGETDFLTSLFTSIIVFSIALNQTLPPRITELYAATPTYHVEMGAMNHFRIPIHRDLGTRPISYLILERFIRHRSEDSFNDQLIVLNLGVKNNHFNTNSLVALLHPFFISHLWHLDVATMMQVYREQSRQAVHILRSSFSQSIETDNLDLALYAAHPPTQFGTFLDSVITFHTKSQTTKAINFLIFSDFVNFCSPFGDGQLFQSLIHTLFSPLTPEGNTTTEKSGMAATIRWLHLTNTWLPKGFDSPLLHFFTPSTLSNRRVTTHELVKLSECGVGREQWNISSTFDGGSSMSMHLEWLCIVARMGHWRFDYLKEADTHTFIRRLLVDCLYV